MRKKAKSNICCVLQKGTCSIDRRLGSHTLYLVHCNMIASTLGCYRRSSDRLCGPRTAVWSRWCRKWFDSFLPPPPTAAAPHTRMVGAKRSASLHHWRSLLLLLMMLLTKRSHLLFACRVLRLAPSISCERSQSPSLFVGLAASSSSFTICKRGRSENRPSKGLVVSQSLRLLVQRRGRGGKGGG